MIRERLDKRIVIAAPVVLALFGGLVAFIGFAGESATQGETRLCGPQGCASFYDPDARGHGMLGEQYARAKNDGTNLPSAYRVPDRHPTM